MCFHVITIKAWYVWSVLSYWGQVCIITPVAEDGLCVINIVSVINVIMRLVIFTDACVSNIFFFFFYVKEVRFLRFLFVVARHPVWGLLETSAACELFFLELILWADFLKSHALFLDDLSTFLWFRTSAISMFVIQHKNVVQCLKAVQTL